VTEQKNQEGSEVERREENGYRERQLKPPEMFPPTRSILAPALCQIVSLEKEPVRVHSSSSLSGCIRKMESSM